MHGLKERLIAILVMWLRISGIMRVVLQDESRYASNV